MFTVTETFTRQSSDGVWPIPARIPGQFGTTFRHVVGWRNQDVSYLGYKVVDVDQTTRTVTHVWQDYAGYTNHQLNQTVWISRHQETVEPTYSRFGMTVSVTTFNNPTPTDVEIAELTSGIVRDSLF
jgi:hypothetical protein